MASPTPPPKAKRPRSTNPLLLTDLPEAVEPELRELQQTCIRLMRLEDQAHFPGSLPVSFERRHLAPADYVSAGRRAVSLMRQEFYAAEKTDGVRYMLLILARGAFMVDRNFEMRRLPPIHFPSRRPDEPLDSTLLDGELVEEEGQGADSRPRLRYLVYDACCVCGEVVTADPLTSRLMAVRREVLAARYAAAMDGAHDFTTEPFAIELKDFFSLAHLPHIFSHVQAQPQAQPQPQAERRFRFHDPVRKVSHGSDGIVFTPVRDAYAPGLCAARLEWRPTCCTSIDFELRAKWRVEHGKKGPQLRYLLMVQDRAAMVGYDWLTLTEEERGHLACHEERGQRGTSHERGPRVVECVFDPAHSTLCYEAEDEAEPTWDHPVVRRGGWRLRRVREDRRLASDLRTVEGLKRAAADGVTQAELLELLGLEQSLSAGGAGFGGA